MGNENYIQNPELQNEQMKDENEVFNSFINVMVQIVEKYGKTVLPMCKFIVLVPFTHLLPSFSPMQH